MIRRCLDRWLPTLALLSLGAAALSAQEPVAGSGPEQLEPSARYRMHAEDVAPTLRWIEDVVALRALKPPFWLREPLPDIDFSEHVGLLCIRPLAVGTAMAWKSGRLDGELFRVRLGATAEEPYVHLGADGAAQGQPPREVGALFVVPRTHRGALVEWQRGKAWSELGRLPPPVDPQQVELPVVSRLWELPDTNLDKLFVERATTAEEWRKLRDAIGPRAADVPPDFVDFADHCVVAVAPGKADSFPNLGVRPATEEGVDVLTITEVRPSGRYIRPHAPVVLLKLPRRERQLTIVIRRVTGPGPGGEDSVRTFPPLR
ncbi:MAG: hypothetical protein VYE77_10545 [Planctomycetota bacterium]|nr:hypothetical protein [Planctomycetota bacterium]